MLKKLIKFLEGKETFIIIIFFAIILRFILPNTPPSLNWDEISHGYNAYSILKTGRDEWGQYLPLSNFRAYGDYPLSLNLYLTMPFIKQFGLNEFSIRLLHRILGVLTVIFVYYFALVTTKSKKMSLISMFLASIDPWLLFTSRFVNQSNLSVFFVVSGFTFLLNIKKKTYFLPLGVFLLGLSLYSYHTTRIFTPLVFAAYLIIFRKDILEVISRSAKIKMLTGLTFALLFIPYLFVMLAPESRARSKEVFIVDQGSVARIERKRSESHLPALVNRVLYNRPVYFISSSLTNLFGYMTPKYLFLEGGTQYQFSVPHWGVLNIINLPFFYLGLLILIFKVFKKDKISVFLLFWFILALIPAAITKEQYAVLRSSSVLPIPEIISVYGLFYVIDLIGKRKFKIQNTDVAEQLLILTYLMGALIVLDGYLNTYFTSYRRDYSWSWQYGYKEVVDYSKTRYKDYDKIVISKKYGEPHEFFLFYWPWEPNKYLTDPNLNRFYQTNWYWVDGFDKFYFINDWQIVNKEPNSNYQFVQESKRLVDCTKSKCLLVTSPNNVPSGWNKLDTISFLDGKPAFEIYEN